MKAAYWHSAIYFVAVGTKPRDIFGKIRFFAKMDSRYVDTYPV